jgi:hypothetical protein
MHQKFDKNIIDTKTEKTPNSWFIVAEAANKDGYRNVPRFVIF